MSEVSPKTRFCPSPTGYLHLGNARTALFNILLAKEQKGIFLLRIEDTDKERSKSEYVTALMEDLHWLGLDWQEGPEEDMGHGPYYQSERQAIYDEYYHLLEKQGKAYPCFCTEEELAIMRKVQRASGRPPRYAGTCYGLSFEEIQQKLSGGLKPTLRFHVPNDVMIEFQDMVRGLQRFSSHDIGDFIIRRTDGTSPFMFCNAIDDAMMGVTHALRGEDHLANTPRQILILRALNLSIPQYGHISLIMGQDGSPLSKRHGSRSIRELREAGFFPQAVNNYMARLGHYYEDDSYMNLAELANKFALTHLGRAPARFDFSQLLRWQQEAIAHQDNTTLWNWMGKNVSKIVPAELQTQFIDTIKHNISFPEDAEKWARIFFEREFTMHPDIAKNAGTHFFATAILAVKLYQQDFKSISDYLQTELSVKGKMLFQPLRMALTGELHGPEMAAIFKILPVAEIEVRFQQAKDLITNEVGTSS